MNTSGVVERLLAGRIGLDVATVGDNLIARGVQNRIAKLGLRDRLEYERLLIKGGDDELQALVEEVVVPESWFFRDARPFEILANHVRDGWLTHPDRSPITVLSLPCAGGEEPYSIAMSLFELGLSGDRFRVDAVDVSAVSVARAIAGVYGTNSFRGVDPSIRLRYFREQGNSYTIDPAVRSSVRFHLGNLLDPGLLADRPPVDVVFCRNVLIYLDQPARSLAYATLGRLLADGGILFLGHADRPDDSLKTPFSPLPEKGGFAYRKGPPVVATPPVSPAIKPRKPIEPPRSAAPPPVAEPVAPRPEPRSVEPPAETARALEEAMKLADQGRYAEASSRVDQVMARNGPSASAYFLMGMIYQADAQRDRAESFFLKAVYLDAQHDEALLALALLARRRGDVAGESVFRRRAERVRTRKEAR